MKLVLPRSIKTFSKKLLVNFLLLSFSFMVFSPTVVAQTRPINAPIQTTTPTNSTVVTNVAKEISTKPVTATVAATAEKGQVQGIVCSILGSVCDFFTNLLEKLAELVLRVVLYVIRIFGSIFGQSSNEACGGDSNCTQSMRNLDPFYDANDTVAKLNVFTIADSSFNNMYTTIPKINSVRYLADDFNQNILGVKVAKAQSLGENTFGGVFKDIWAKFKDLTYIAMVLVLVTIGFMVMLRRRLDPRTVVTATNSLPRVVISLILITFSFAISGLFIDFIHISVSLVRNYMGDLGGFSGLLTHFGGAGGELIWLPFFTLFSKSILQFGAMITLLGAAGVIFVIPGPNFIAILLLIAAFGLDLLIRIFMFILAAMLFWSLAMRFVTLLILTIFSPVFFFFGAVPGFEGVVTTWFRRMASSALCFPIMLVLIYIAMALVGYNSVGNPFNNGGVSAPPPIGETGLVINIGVLVGVGVIFFAQKVPAFVDEMLGIKPSGGGSGRGGGVGLGAAISAPLALGKGWSTLNNSAGAIAPITTAAVQRGGLIGRLAAPLHTGARFLNDQSRSYMPSVKEIREGQVERKLQSGRLGWAKRDAVDAVKTNWKENWKKNAVLTPGIDADIQAERAWGQTFDNYARSAGAPPGLAPGRTPADSAAAHTRLIRNYEQELRNQGATDNTEIERELTSWVRSGLNDPKKRVRGGRIVP